MADYRATRPLTALFVANNTVSVHHEATTLKPAMIAGDAIHCLRVALDLMASELARINGKTDKDVYFPFAANAEALEAQIENKCFTKAGDDAVELLISLKPYKGGNVALRAIHDFDIQDKHNGVSLAYPKRDMTVDVIVYPDTGAREVFVRDNSTNYVFPPNVPDFGGKDVVETLKQFAELVSGILEAFAALVASRQ